MEQKYSSEITFQKQKLVNGEYVNIGLPHIQSNAITEVGMTTIDPTQYQPNFPEHYIHIGGDYYPEYNQGGISIATKLRNPKAIKKGTMTPLTTTPQNVDDTMLLRTYTVSARFDAFGEETHIQEVGIGNNSNQDGSLYTYTYLKGIKGEPLNLRLLEDELLLITYIYQVRSYQYLPNSVSIQGDGIPTNIEACLYRVDDSITRGYYYYRSEEDFQESGWYENHKNFYREDNKGLLFSQNFGNQNINSNMIIGQSTGYSNMLANQQKMPSYHNLTGQNNTFIPPFSWPQVDDDEIRYIVQLRTTSHYCLVFNRPIPFQYTQGLTLENLIPHTFEVVPYVDPRGYN